MTTVFLMQPLAWRHGAGLLKRKIAGIIRAQFPGMEKEELDDICMDCHPGLHAQYCPSLIQFVYPRAKIPRLLYFQENLPMMFAIPQ